MGAVNVTPQKVAEKRVIMLGLMGMVIGGMLVAWIWDSKMKHFGITRMRGRGICFNFKRREECSGTLRASA